MENQNPEQPNQPQTPTPDPSPPPTPPPSEKKPVNWPFIGVSGLLVIALGIAGFFAYQNYNLKQQEPQVQPTPAPEISITSPTPTTNLPTPTPDQSADWKTYSTSTYQVKYPNDLTVREEEASTLILSKWGPTQKEDTELYDGIAVSFQPFEIPNIDLEAYVRLKIQETEAEGNAEVLSGPTQITIGDHVGFTYTAQGLGIHKYIYFQSADKVMLVEIIDSTNDPTEQGFQQIVDKIISTFTFI